MVVFKLFKQQPFEKDAGMTSPSKGLSFFHKKKPTTIGQFGIQNPTSLKTHLNFFFSEKFPLQAGIPSTTATKAFS